MLEHGFPICLLVSSTFAGDGARRDADGYYWITGRVDDVINVSGHRIGTAEVESALVAHPKCAEAAVVGYDHPIKVRMLAVFPFFQQAQPCVVFLSFLPFSYFLFA